MKAEIVTAVLILLIMTAVLLTTDFVGVPDLVLDTLVFVLVVGILGVRLWLGAKPRG